MNQDNVETLLKHGFSLKEKGWIKKDHNGSFVKNENSNNYYFSEIEALAIIPLIKNPYFQKYGIIESTMTYDKSTPIYSFEEYKDKSTDHNKNNPLLEEIFSNNPNIKLHECFFYLKNRKMPLSYFVAKNIILLSYGLPCILHEIAHIVEMTDYARLLKPDMGMAIELKKMSNKGLLCAIARESRVRAIQYIIGNRQAKLFDNYVWERIVNDKIPLGKFKTFKEVLKWSNIIYDNTLEEWNLDKIKEEWFKKMNYIQNWMDQQPEIKKGDTNEITL